MEAAFHQWHSAALSGPGISPAWFNSNILFPWLLWWFMPQHEDEFCREMIPLSGLNLKFHVPFALRSTPYSFPSHSFSVHWKFYKPPSPVMFLLIKELLSLLSQTPPSFLCRFVFFVIWENQNWTLFFIIKYGSLHNCRIIFVCFQLFSKSCNFRKNIAFKTPKKSFRLKPHVVLKDIIHKHCLLNWQYFICFILDASAYGINSSNIHDLG